MQLVGEEFFRRDRCVYGIRWCREFLCEEQVVIIVVLEFEEVDGFGVRLIGCVLRVGVVGGTWVSESEGGYDVVVTDFGLAVRVQARHGVSEVVLFALLVLNIEVELRKS